MYNVRNLVIIMLAVLLTASLVMAQNNSGKVYANEENVAIKGYDVVSYFTQNKATRGSKKFSAKHNGVNYWFASAENRQLFEKDPEKYTPQYGGYCAFAMGKKNAKVPSNPETFKLVNGKLFLFYNDYMQGEPFNTIIPWNANEQATKKLADANWKAMNK